ncbi:MAG: NAD-dependent epimerase/dehydratase family protein [Chthonomonadales bacterium]
MTFNNFPSNDHELDSLVSQPNDITIESLRHLDGDILILGAGGKMGISLATLAQNTIDHLGNSTTVTCVSRFSDSTLVAHLETHGIQVIQRDLLEHGALDSLPDAENILYLPGMKFGSTGNPGRTWAMNVHLAGLVATRFRNSRIVALSSGNVYPFAKTESNGCTELDVPAPVGEYAITCLGRERMFQWAAEEYGTKCAIVRLNYATDLRYGVLVDIATRVRSGAPIDLGQSWFNTVWQGYANSVLFGLFQEIGDSPLMFNLTGPEKVSVVEAATQFGRIFGVEPNFVGTDSGEALLNDATQCFELFGKPSIGVQELIGMTAHWIQSDGRLLNKPTHFEATDGKF